MPILVHAGDNRYDNSNPNRLAPILKIYSGLRIVGAHLGGYSVWDDAIRELCDFENLYVDCSSTFSFIGGEAAREIILRYGTDRVLFGTDYLMWNPARELDIFFSLGFSDEDNRKILSENAIKVFDIK